MNSSLNPTIQQNAYNHAHQHTSNTLPEAVNFQQAPTSIATITYLNQQHLNDINSPLANMPCSPSTEANTSPSSYNNQSVQITSSTSHEPHINEGIVDESNSINITPSEKLYTNHDVEETLLLDSSVALDNNFTRSCSNVASLQMPNAATEFTYITGAATIQQTPGVEHHHVYNINNNICKDSQPIAESNVLHLKLETPQEQVYQQLSMVPQQSMIQQPHVSSLLQPNAQVQTPHITEQHSVQLQLPATQQFYMPSEPAFPTQMKVSSVSTPLASTTSNSTVVLDRINICINNHYSDNSNCAQQSAKTHSSTSNTEQQPSPIIPIIQHKPIVDSARSSFNSCSNTNSSLIIDEPDSTTTTPNTPPTTPEKSSPVSSLSEELIDITKSNNDNDNDTDLDRDRDTSYREILWKSPKHEEDIDNSSKNDIPKEVVDVIKYESTEAQSNEKGNENSKHIPELIDFIIGEDVFIKRQDGRFYLGTIIDKTRQQFLVRFDDKSEVWCKSDEMRKLSGQTESNVEKGPMCVACKRPQHKDIVEICERCGRGYHRRCTTETTPGSGDWLCKRCGKSMKVLCPLEGEKLANTTHREFPYRVDQLSWDKNHRVNEEQIYCYCGKFGKFDQNMLQCCLCKNWFHTFCIQDVKYNILRGDGFFIFCCAVCHRGDEFLRRLQITWVDLVHLTLYNLSAMKKHQHNKYHHLLNDIMPFILEKKNRLPIPVEWRQMPDTNLMETVKQTLEKNVDRFMCGRENKRDQYYYALRNNGPPILPNINIESTNQLCDEFLEQKLKLTLHRSPSEGKSRINMDRYSVSKSKQSKYNDFNDIYEFRVDEDDTSEDEIPIKHMMENMRKTKVHHNADQTNMNAYGNYCGAENSKMMRKVTKIDHNMSEEDLNENKINQSIGDNADVTSKEKSSRKRKAFTLSKTYRDFVADTTSKRYDGMRAVDSSSDENSSSSRGTSLDVIIPPPKNFLGQNNPFRMITPKKNSESNGKKCAFNRNVTVIKKSIFHTTTFDLGAKLAALKSAGVIPNVSTSHLTKAAGQLRTVRTIKRRLSAKDIMIGPNQEVRRRRIRRSSSNFEVISTTTINPLPSTLFPTTAKDLCQSSNNSKSSNTYNSASSASSSSPPASTSSSMDSLPRNHAEDISQVPLKVGQGRRLRQRPQKTSASGSRRSSISSGSTSSSTSNSSSVCDTTPHTGFKASVNDTSMQDLKQSVNKYFGVGNRFETGEPFKVVAKRTLNNGEVQYLIEWGDSDIHSNWII